MTKKTVLFCALFFLFFGFSAFAEEINLLYTADTHATLYPCNCPIEPDGGILRRSALIKKLRQENPAALLLDSGGFFAGGLLDERTQNTQMDMRRTEIYLEAMEKMRYDAVNISEDEFNFGREFLEENAAKLKMPFISSNINFKEKKDKSGLFKPYVIKEINGIKFGIISIASRAVLHKVPGLEFIEPKEAVKKAVEELKKQRVDIIVLLSRLGKDEEAKLIDGLSGVDVVITGYNRGKDEQVSKQGLTLFARPFWQGRRMGKLSLTITDKKITDYKAQELRLSNEVPDDQDARAILPACFADDNCVKNGYTGVCRDPGSAASNCVFAETPKVSLVVIMPKQKTVYDVDMMLGYLKKHFPGITAQYLYYPDKESDKFVKEYSLKTLPAFLFGKEVEKEKAFKDGFKENLEVKGNYYLLKKETSGASYLLSREKIPGKIDLFVSLFEEETAGLLEAIKEYNPDVHFLAIEKDSEFSAAKGRSEVEEYLRASCVRKYYPDKFLDYISCRAKNVDSSWWQDCAVALDSGKITACARSMEGQKLLRENIKFNKEINAMFGPIYVLDNQEVFSTKGAISKEGLKKILRK